MKKWKLIMMMLCGFVMGVSGKYLLDYHMASVHNSQAYIELSATAFSDIPEESASENESERISDEPSEISAETEAPVSDSFDFVSLQAVNHDCIGWIRIEGTDIDYPIVQAADNSFYLSRNFNGESAICGTIFADCRNEVGREGENLILYGHQMKDGSMFRQLNGYREEGFFEEHKEITLYLQSDRYEYDVAAVYVTDLADSSSYYSYLHKENRKEQLEYLQEHMAAYQLYDTGITVDEDDELLSLSTCEYSSSNGRLIVLAIRRDAYGIHENDKRTETAAGSGADTEA